MDLTEATDGARSIPAHTGKPSPSCPACAAARVYPRPHGEAPGSTSLSPSCIGLSPPTRGSLDHIPQPARRARSIPAHTGKPAASLLANKYPTVYPRPHGEADV